MKNDNKSKLLEALLNSIKDKALNYNSQLKRDAPILDDILKTKEKYSVRYKSKPHGLKKNKCKK